MGSRILKESFARATLDQRSKGQSALMDALSAYNSGNFRSGFSNGYVTKYYPHLKLKSSASLQKLPVARLTQDELINIWMAKPIRQMDSDFQSNRNSNYVTAMKSPKAFKDTPPSPSPSPSKFQYFKKEPTYE